MAEARQAGEVVDWKDKGYGFIRPADGDRDVFFHASDIETGPVAAGSLVTYVPAFTDKGQRATQVRAVASSLPPEEDVADVLTPEELWDEVAPELRRALVMLARRHNWVE